MYFYKKSFLIFLTELDILKNLKKEEQHFWPFQGTRQVLKVGWLIEYNIQGWGGGSEG